MSCCTARTLENMFCQYYDKLVSGFRSVWFGKCRRCGSLYKVYSVHSARSKKHTDLLVKPCETITMGEATRTFSEDELLELKRRMQ